MPFVAVAMAVSVSACADLAYDDARAPMPVLAEHRSSSSDGMLDNMDYLPADKVIDAGEKSGERNGETWICANPDCTVAQRERGSPPPHAQDKPRQF